MRSIRNELTALFVLEVSALLSVVSWASYRWTRNITERKVSESTVTTLAQIDRNFASMLDGAHDISLFLIANRNARSYLKAQDLRSHELIAIREALNDDLANLVTSKSYILSINLYGDNGLSYESAGPSNAAAEAPDLPASGEAVLSGTYFRRYQALGRKTAISFYRRINDTHEFTRRLGMARIDIDEAAIREVYRNATALSAGYIFLTDEAGRVRSHPDIDRIGTELAADPVFGRAFAEEDGYYRMDIDGVDTLVTHYRSPRGVSVSVRPFRELARGEGETRRFSMILFLSAASVAAVLAWWIASKITLPLKDLVAGMRSVEAGTLGAEVRVIRDDEIGELTRSFNSMSANLRKLVDEVYKSGLAKKEAEIKALQAQINPHFLYNTLDVIYWTARTEGAPRAAEAAAALSRMFKLGLNKGEELTTLAEEIRHLESYAVIQNMRFDDPPELSIDIPEGLRDCVVTKLVLQPLVENAYLHGIADLDRPGRIDVRGGAAGGVVRLVVEDNGVGMDQDRIAEVFLRDMSGERGFGVRNVDQTVKLFFGSDYGLSIESVVGSYTRAVLRFPERHAGGGSICSK